MFKKLESAALIDPSASVIDCNLGQYTEVGARTRLTETVLGDFSYIVNDGEVIHSVIGKFCSIAAAVRINPGNHPYWRASQHHFTYRSQQYGFEIGDDMDFFQWRRDHPVTIGHDVWIGHGAVVMPGITIGHGAIVGAAAVVTKDVAPYSIVAGVPAKPIRQRFPEQLAHALMTLAWWDWDHQALERALVDMRVLDIEAFVAKYS